MDQYLNDLGIPRANIFNRNNNPTNTVTNNSTNTVTNNSTNTVTNNSTNTVTNNPINNTNINRENVENVGNVGNVGNVENVGNVGNVENGRLENNINLEMRNIDEPGHESYISRTIGNTNITRTILSNNNGGEIINYQLRTVVNPYVTETNLDLDDNVNYGLTIEELIQNTNINRYIDHISGLYENVSSLSIESESDLERDGDVSNFSGEENENTENAYILQGTQENNINNEYNSSNYISNNSSTLSNDSSNNTGEICPICRCKFEDEDFIRIINRCGHYFHNTCIETWLNNHITCPNCRQNVIIIEDAIEDPGTNINIV
jgi:hypothetical protein